MGPRRKTPLPRNPPLDWSFYPGVEGSWVAQGALPLIDAARGRKGRRMIWAAAKPQASTERTDSTVSPELTFQQRGQNRHLHVLLSLCSHSKHSDLEMGWL